MTDFGDSFGNNVSEKAGDKELQEFLMVEKQKAQFNAQVYIFFNLTYKRFTSKYKIIK